MTERKDNPIIREKAVTVRKSWTHWVPFLRSSQPLSEPLRKMPSRIEIGGQIAARLKRLEKEMGKEGELVAMNMVRQIRRADINWRDVEKMATETGNRSLALNLVAVMTACNRDRELMFAAINNEDPVVREACLNGLAELQKRFMRSDGEGFEGAKEVLKEVEIQRQRLEKDREKLDKERKEFEKEKEKEKK